MTAPDRPGIESTLTDAFTRRHAGQRATRPSLVDVRRRAHRRSTRNAAVRSGAVVAAGAAVVAGGWAVTRRDSSPAAAPAVPVNEVAPSDGSPDQMVTTLSVEGLWNAVAAQLGVGLEDLRNANPSVDLSRAPVPGTPIVVPVDPFQSGVPTTTPAPQTTFIVTAPPTTFVHTTTTGRIIPGTTDTTTTGPVTTDATATTPPPPPGWAVYRIVTGDYLAAVAERFCTTMDVIVEANNWSAGVNTPIYPDDLILVPADAC
jgi:LysM repeat protein